MMPGSSEWLIILGIALLIFGPSKLPQLGGAMGASIRNFKKGMKGLESEIEKPDHDKIASQTAKKALPSSQ